MDLKKVFDQTVRELKREVNKKVLKVPEIEVKILEATSNEPWGPHGSIMGDIAQATRNYNDYQMIMAVLYKRLNDTGRNWRHVYKALTVLEFLVANGAERVIDELQEHTYQIQALCDFQYMEASGKDQGINVRKKAQTLVALIKDKDKIREVRQKAAANRDKYRGVSSTGMPHRTYSSGGGGYGDRDEDRYGGGRGGRDEYDYSGRGSGGRGGSGDRYRDDDSYGKDRNRNSDYEGRDGSKEREAYNSKGGDRYDKYESGASSDRDREDDSYTSRNGKAKGSSTPPPAYEEAVQRAAPEEDREETQGVAAAVARAQNTQAEATVIPAPVPAPAPEPATKSNGGSFFATPAAADDDFDDFDPRGTFTATPAPAPAAAPQPTEDFFAESATPSFFPESTPAPPPPAPVVAQKSLGGLEDLFGDVSFGAAPAAPAPATSFAPSQAPSNDLFGDSFSATPSTATDAFGASAFQAPSSQPDSFGAAAFQVPSSQPDAFGASAFQAPPSQSDAFGATPFQAPPSQPDAFGGSAFQAPQADAFGASSFQAPPPAPASDMFGGSFQLAPPPPPPPAYQAPPSNNFGGNNSFQSYGAPNGNGSMYGQAPTPFDAAPHNGGLAHARHNSFSGLSQSQSAIPSPYGAPQSMGGGLNRSSSAPHPLNQLQQPVPQPQRKDFGPVKSAIWGDTLSMGLVDLNIAGPKVNPLNDLGIHLTDPTLKNELWGADNPKQVQKKATSTSGMGMGMAMGKAMGSGSGLGRSGATGLPPTMPAPQMMRPQMGMGFNMGMGMNPGMGVSPGMGMGMGMGMNPQMGMGMNQMQMQQQQQQHMGGYPNQQQQQYNGYR